MISGVQFIFDQELSVNVRNEQDWRKDTKGAFVVFKRINLNEANNNEADRTDSASMSNNNELTESMTLNVGEQINEEIIFANFEDLESQLSGLYTKVGENFRCSSCGFLTSEMTFLFDHILQKHSETETKSVTQNSTQLGNVHINPQWKQNLKVNSDDLIIGKCSEATRIAWQTKEKLRTRAKFLEVRGEILKMVINHIVDVFGTVSSPKVSSLESVVKDILAVGYPFMFADSETSTSNDKNLGFGYGAGGVSGVKYLPKQLWDKIYQKQTVLRTQNSQQTNNPDDDCVEDSALSKKGRKPFKYGEFIFIDICLKTL